MIFSWLVVYGIRGILRIENIFFFAAFMAGNLVHSYIYHKNDIEFYNNFRKRENKKTDQKGLASQLLPAHVTIYLVLLLIRFFLKSVLQNISMIQHQNLILEIIFKMLL